MVTDFELILFGQKYYNLCRHMAQSADIMNTLTPTGCYCARDWRGLATAQRGGAGARKRGAPESPVFCGAKNAPPFSKNFARGHCCGMCKKGLKNNENHVEFMYG
jgi:hypothetical protein